MADYEDEDKVEIETEPDGSNFVKEHDDAITCVV